MVVDSRQSGPPSCTLQVCNCVGRSRVEESDHRHRLLMRARRHGDRKGPLPALLFAVNMLVNSEEGNTFSLEEITDWLREAGFEQVQTVEAPGLAPRIILATKAKRLTRGAPHSLNATHVRI